MAHHAITLVARGYTALIRPPARWTDLDLLSHARPAGQAPSAGRLSWKATDRVRSKASRTLPGRQDTWAATPGWHSGRPRQKSHGLFAPMSAFSGRWRLRSKRSSLCLLPILAFRQVANALQPVLPAFGHSVAMFGQDEPNRAVEERKARHAPFRLEAVLQVIDRGVRHHQRAANLQETRRLDDLHMAPQVAGIVAEVAVPASAGPRLDFHRERLAAEHLIFRPDLVQHGCEGDVDRRRNLDLLADLQRFD